MAPSSRKASLPGWFPHQLDQPYPTWFSTYCTLFPCPPVGLFQQVSYTLPQEPGDTLPSCYYKTHPTALLVHSAPGATSMRSCLACRILRDICDWQMNVHLTSPLLGVVCSVIYSCIGRRIPPLSNMVNREVIRTSSKERKWKLSKWKRSLPWVLGVQNGLDNHQVLCFPAEKILGAYFLSLTYDLKKLTQYLYYV